jgi:hypothetical protein
VVGSTCRDYIINDLVDATIVEPEIMISPYSFGMGNVVDLHMIDFTPFINLLKEVFQEDQIDLVIQPDKMGVRLRGEIACSPFAGSFVAMALRTFMPLNLSSVKDIEDIGGLYKKAKGIPKRDLQRIKENNAVNTIKWPQFLKMVPVIARAYNFTPEMGKKFTNNKVATWLQLAAIKHPEVSSSEIYYWAHSLVTVMATWEFMSNLYLAHQHKIPTPSTPRDHYQEFNKFLPQGVRWCIEQNTVRCDGRGDRPYNMALSNIPLMHAGILLNDAFDKKAPTILNLGKLGLE